MQALDIHNTRDLEDLCINTIYASLLTGKLSPYTQTFQITSCTSRDISPTTTDFPGMIETLGQWSKQCDLVLAEIAGRIRDAKQAAAARKLEEALYEKELEAAKKQSQPKGKGKGKAPVGSQQVRKGSLDGEMMQDIEEHELISPRQSMAGGGDSPSGRKRKLVRTPVISSVHFN